MYVATERGTSDNPEATRFSQSAHDQRRRLEAEDSVRQHPMCPINFRWEETYTPTTLPRSRSPHNVLHSPSYSLARALGGRAAGDGRTSTLTEEACPSLWRPLNLAIKRSRSILSAIKRSKADFDDQNF